MAELPHVTTSWTLIRQAVQGQPEARDRFARLYEPVVQAFLRRSLVRLRATVRSFSHELDNVSQDVFLECFKPQGALERLDRSRCSRFRAYLFGVIANITRRSQTRWARQRREHLADGPTLESQARQDSALSRTGEFAEARQLLAEAVRRQADYAGRLGDAAQKRIELLQLCFTDGLTLFQVARRWQTNVQEVRREYKLATQEFKEALRETLDRRYPGSPEGARQAFRELLETLGCHVPRERAGAVEGVGQVGNLPPDGRLETCPTGPTGA
jgi:RNA polymerase sigma factor (sigma-70 family)